MFASPLSSLFARKSVSAEEENARWNHTLLPRLKTRNGPIDFFAPIDFVSFWLCKRAAARRFLPTCKRTRNGTRQLHHAREKKRRSVRGVNRRSWDRAAVQLSFLRVYAREVTRTDDAQFSINNSREARAKIRRPLDRQSSRSIITIRDGPFCSSRGGGRGGRRDVTVRRLSNLAQGRKKPARREDRRGLCFLLARKRGEIRGKIAFAVYRRLGATRHSIVHDLWDFDTGNRRAPGRSANLPGVSQSSRRRPLLSFLVPLLLLSLSRLFVSLGRTEDWRRVSLAAPTRY